MSAEASVPAVEARSRFPGVTVPPEAPQAEAASADADEQLGRPGKMLLFLRVAIPMAVPAPASATPRHPHRSFGLHHPPDREDGLAERRIVA